jgi:hypothetical protein
MSKSLGLKWEMGGGAGESPGWWLCVGAAAEATHATNNISSRRIMANQSKSGSESNATADAFGYNGHSSGAKLPTEAKCIGELNGMSPRISSFCLISHDEGAARGACSKKNLLTLPRRGKHSAQYGNDVRGDALYGSTSRHYCLAGGGHSAFTSSAAVPSGARRPALLVFRKDQQFPS